MLDISSDGDGFVFVCPHKGNGLKPALEKCADRVGLLGDEDIGRRDHILMEVRHVVAKVEEQLASALFLGIEGG